MSALEVVTRIEELPLSADPLDRLNELREAKNMVERLIDQAVNECRTNGTVERGPDPKGDGSQWEATRPVSWAKIGGALGISRQSAYERFRHNA